MGISFMLDVAFHYVFNSYLSPTIGLVSSFVVDSACMVLTIDDHAIAKEFNNVTRNIINDSITRREAQTGIVEEHFKKHFKNLFTTVIHTGGLVIYGSQDSGYIIPEYAVLLGRFFGKSVRSSNMERCGFANRRDKNEIYDTFCEYVMGYSKWDGQPHYIDGNTVETFVALYETERNHNNAQQIAF